MEIDRNDFERRVLSELRGILLDGSSCLGRPEDPISVEDVYRDDTVPEHALIVLLRVPSRSGCLFGWRWPLERKWSEDPIMTADPNLLATVVWANLEERLVGGPGLPGDCIPSGVTWF